MDLAVAKGADRQALAQRSKIDLRDLQDQDKRIPVANYIGLMRAGKECSGDPALALHLGERDLSETSIVGLLGPASETAIDSIVQLNRYARLAIEVDLEVPDRFRIERGDGGLWLIDARLNPNDFPELTEMTFAQIACGVGAIASGSRAFAETPLLKAVHVTHTDPGYRAEYDRIFRAPVVFESARNAILLDQAFLTLRFRRQPLYAFNALTERAEVLLENMASATSTRGRVECLLAPMLHKGDIGVDAVAAELGMSRWTLLRHLKAEGANFRLVLDELRRKFALHYLSVRDLSLSETAYLVGFSDQAAFSRAFKRWTGRRPREARM
jgi:AraC-like DNA-binding protein